MSQITLLNETEARLLEKEFTSYKEGCTSEVPTETFETCSEQAYQDEEEEEPVYYDPPVIHMLRLGDTMRSIAKKYSVDPIIIERANRFREITPDLLQKRKFVVIPSASTFREYIFESEQEQIELIKNFCLFFPDVDCDQADYFLGRCSYNLAIAVEQYQFELV